ncbi:uncharacterized protein LOC111445139 [Cucurbita moschata]|uniref:Uncharacterized protein LOC111445139 n=1 Tax=Cucurbita moschata TaxID=3662 RepID=A0A6J1FKU7_CUCMO|nr:uncharacterized protein LOC111445139 [Cucurbita moschata]
MIVAKDSYRGEDASINEDHPYPHDEEAEETLSLCDLPIFSDESNCDKQDRSASFDNEDTFFEFFSDNYSVSDSTYSGSGDIIFCGKFIPEKQPSESQNTERIASEKFSEKNCQFRTKSHSFDAKKSSAIDAKGCEIAYASTTRRVKSFDPHTVSLLKNPECIKRKRTRKMEKYDLPAERAMIMESWPKKSRWFLFLFGSMRLPKEMELSEIRTRQQRSRRPAMFLPSEERTVGRGSSGKKTTAHVMWKVLRTLVMGCSSSDQNVVVNGSLRPIPVAWD